ncbi:MAG: hypothetical protein M3680_29880, partial [Myxococcota bacterium]|nr:hypothetical protein [Myxococcota bacterium]
MGTKRVTKPPPPPVQPVDRHGLTAALQLFVTRFVISDKQAQLHKRLLTAERRGETLGAVVRWIAGPRAALAGAD